MKSLIVGSGVIGTIYGWALSEAGVDVTHFVRQGKCENSRRGLALDILDERKGHKKYNTPLYIPRCTESISSSDMYELVIVPTNSYQVEQAVCTILPHAPDAVFLIFAANWEGTDSLDRLLPRERYLMGYPDGGGTIRNGVYWTNLGPEVHLGEVDGQRSQKLERVEKLFVSADMEPDIQDNILHWLWLHNAMSIGIWAGFAKYREVEPFLKDRHLLIQCYQSTRELLGLCRQRGINLRQYPETVTFRLPTWLFIILFRWLYTHNESMKRFTAHAAASIPEAKQNYDAMLRTASELGFDMPQTRALGAFLSPS